MCPDGSPSRTVYWDDARCVGTCPHGRPPELVSLDEYLQFGLDDLFGSKVHPRSRHQLCAQLGINNSQLLPGTNNWSSVVHLFTGAARKSYDNLKSEYDSATSMRMIRNGTIDTMKLMLRQLRRLDGRKSGELGRRARSAPTLDVVMRLKYLSAGLTPNRDGVRGGHVVRFA